MGGGEVFKAAARPEGEGGLQYHLRVRSGDVARYVLLPGDPERTDIIASLWDEASLVASHREYRTWSGVYKGARISVTSTGIGGPSTAIAVEELFRVGADTFIRVGTMGGLRRELSPGTLVIAVGAVRLEGASRQYVMPEYPAVASYDVVLALVEAAESLGVDYSVGIVASTDSFYLGQGRPGFKGYMTPRAASIIPELQSAGVLGFEMEAATIFTVASIYGGRAGCVCSVVANRETEEFVVDAGVREASKVASEAVAILKEWDEARERAGKRWLYPSLIARSTSR